MSDVRINGKPGTLRPASSIGNILSLASKAPSFNDLESMVDNEAAVTPAGTTAAPVAAPAVEPAESIEKKLTDQLHEELDGIHKSNALIRWWKPFVGTAWSFFIIYQISMALDREYNENPLCPYSDRDYPDWYFYIVYAVFGGFLLILAVLFMKLFQMESGNKRVPIFVAFHIVSMGSIATLLAIVFEIGGVCIDVLNVATPSSIWGEWMACGPLLFFITFTVVDKPDLTRSDIFFMLMFFICLLTGFFIIPEQPYASGAFWLAVSCATYIPVLVVPWYEDSYLSPDDPDISRAERDRQQQMFAERYAMRYNLAMWLEIVLPLYTVNYLVATWGGIDAPTTIVIYQVLSVLTKGLFAACTMDIHLDLLIGAEKALIEEKRANEARRAFMKYIFHEVRTPLNSLTMGIDLLTMSDNLDELDRESLAMMKAASEFMSDTLDDVLSIQKIEEGKLELEMGPFSFEHTIKRVFATFRGAVTKKQISLSYGISPNTPYRLIGDIHRIEHVISNLLSNAIKFTPEGKHITVNVFTESIKASTKNSSDSVASVTVSIDDQGPGISKENQQLLFNNFVQIRPGALQNGQGSGLGLSFCKQIVQLHGGTIAISSEGEGRGSKFFFTIPYVVSAFTSPDGEAAIAEQDPRDTDDDQVGLSLGEDDIPPPAAEGGSLVLTHNSIVRENEDVNTADTAVGGAGAVAPSLSASSFSATNTAAAAAAVATASTNGLSLAPPTTSTTPPPAAKKAAAAAADQPPQKEAGSSFEVLVVDDADSNRKMLTMLLKRKGLVSHTAENGQIAVDMVKGDIKKYKLVLMDNLMPVMNGVDAAKAMRLAGFPYLIAGITGNVMEDDIDEYLAAGADLVISKPLKRTTLDMLVKHIDENGPLSKSGFRLIEQVDSMEWLRK